MTHAPLATLRKCLTHSYALLAVLLLASCSSNLSTPGEALRLIADPLAPAFINEDYSANVRVVGGLPPYRFELTAGALPPGITLQGGTLRGTPSSTGDYRFTITVSDGNLSRTFQEYSLSVREPPPAELTLNVPNTDIQRPVTLRAEVKNARGLEAFRTLITWDAELFRFVEGSLQRASRNYAIFFEASEGALQVDVAMLGGRLDNDRRVFEFTLEPQAVTTLGIETQTEFLAANNRHSFVTAFEGQRSSLSADEPFPDDGFEPTEPPDDPLPEEDADSDPDGEGTQDADDDPEQEAP
jgi:hypothetical protein